MRRSTTLLVVAVLALAGCSSAGSPTTTAAAPTAPPSASDVATKASCTGWAATTGQLEMYVKESGTCTVGAAQINVDTFNDQAARDNYLKIAKSFGGSFGQGALWVIHGDDAAAVSKAVSAAGGSNA